MSEDRYKNPVYMNLLCVYDLKLSLLIIWELSIVHTRLEWEVGVGGWGGRQVIRRVGVR